MKTITSAVLSVLFVLPLSGASSDSVYVGHDRVTAALSSGGALISLPNVKVAGVHRDKPGPLDTQRDTTILYVTSGAATFVAGGETRQVTQGDVVVVPGGTTQAFSVVTAPISCYVVTVPVVAAGAKAVVTFVDHDKVAAALKKAGPLADAPNARVSGGYRTGPYAPADYRPDVEVHASEADLFYVIDGDATLITGGTVIGGRETAPGQIRGSRIEGGQTSHLTKGDVMWVPAGAPHWFPAIPKPLSYLLVKVLQ